MREDSSNRAWVLNRASCRSGEEVAFSAVVAKAEKTPSIWEKKPVPARVAEQGLDPVVQFVLYILAVGLGARVQAGGLQEAVGGQTDARDIDAAPHAFGRQGDLIGDLTDIAGRVDVGDVVGNDPQLGLGRGQTAVGDVED
jgi:hypothetical protein